MQETLPAQDASPHNEWLDIRQSNIHSFGAFATRNIPKGTRVIEYTGEKVTSEECKRREDQYLAEHKQDPAKGGVYLFELDDDWTIDANRTEDIAKYINHSCDPNCEIEMNNGHIWIVALRYIAAGEELTYNYGFDIEDVEDYPCQCGSARCVGYILDEDEWPKLRGMIPRFTRNLKRFLV
ncbi:SET domain-containing protein-lysine N-methyltransferase [Candidatus Woesearchaeota archaeon]|nr:SET domain-containing protein-lysine N-methyltransferase [Candidatus Woesearchaeota archaeon]